MRCVEKRYFLDKTGVNLGLESVSDFSILEYFVILKKGIILLVKNTCKYIRLRKYFNKMAEYQLSSAPVFDPITD